MGDSVQGSADCRRKWNTALIPRSSGTGTHPTNVECAECESIDPLDDTPDARWISLISVTMRHVFDSLNHEDT